MGRTEDVSAAIALLIEDNPRAKLADCRVYATAYVEWMEADVKITKNGLVVANPTNGLPMENPYIRVRAAARAEMARLDNIRHTDRLWK